MALEPDLALRYALWRLCALARGGGDLALQAHRIRILPGHRRSGGGEGDRHRPYLLLEGDGQRALEWVWCTDPVDGYLESAVLRRFVGWTQRLRRDQEGVGGALRMVSSAWLYRCPDGQTLLDLTDLAERERALDQGLPRDLLADLAGIEVSWDLGRHRPDRLTHECVFHLADGGIDNPALACQGLYESLRDQIQAVLRPRDENTLKNLEIYLYADASQERRPPHFARVGEVAFWRDHLVRPPVPEEVLLPFDADRITSALRRGLFDETEVTLEEIYVQQKGLLQLRDEQRQRTELFNGGGPALLFRWLTETIRGSRRDLPLLVLGSFGCGKSSLLSIFAEILLRERTSIVPILVPLRDLRGANPNRPLDEVLIAHVRRQWNVDLRSVPAGGGRYCLLCDGFDELSLYYQAVESAEWVSECFRSLMALCEERHIEMVISSRPILLMDASRRDSQALECPRLDLSLFGRLEIDQWCTRYRRAAQLGSFFDGNYLEQRQLLEVGRTPLILYLLARLFEDERESLEAARAYTRAEIYGLFIDKTCKKGGYEREPRKHLVPARYRSILQDIGWFFFQSGDAFVREDQLIVALRHDHGERTPDKVPVGSNLLVAHMLQPVEAADEEREHNLIEFTHQSFREYLTAEWLWKRLEGARTKGVLEPSFWGRFSRKALGEGEIAFLGDMITDLSWEQARSLYQALEGTENVNQYWSKWQRPMWEELRQSPDSRKVEEADGYVATTLSRACQLATLGLILRVRAYARLRTLALNRDAEVLPQPIAAEDLSRLLHLLKTLPKQGVGGDSSALLLAHLEGVVLCGVAMTGHQLSNPNFRSCVMRKINFTGSRWLEADIRDADLTGALFNTCLLTFRRSEGACIAEAELSDAILTHPKDSAIVGVDFRDASFYRARLLDLTLIDCRFVGNRWEGAGRLHSQDERPLLLEGCQLDEAAERFFVTEGFTLERCRRI